MKILLFVLPFLKELIHSYLTASKQVIAWTILTSAGLWISVLLMEAFALTTLDTLYLWMFAVIIGLLFQGLRKINTLIHLQSNTLMKQYL